MGRWKLQFMIDLYSRGFIVATDLDSIHIKLFCIDIYYSWIGKGINIHIRRGSKNIWYSQ